MKRCLIFLILSLTACRLMALPESQRDTCTATIHDWHVERVANIHALTVPDEIKAEMIAFSALDESRQFQDICDIGGPPSQAAKFP